VRCVKKCMGVCRGTDVPGGDHSIFRNRTEGQIGRSLLVWEQPGTRKGAQSCMNVRSVRRLLFNALNYNLKLSPYRTVNSSSRL
jgi:hypothetical protein